MAKPEIVAPGPWQQARDELLVAEMEATRELDAPGGPVTLLDLTRRLAAAPGLRLSSRAPAGGVRTRGG